MFKKKLLVISSTDRVNQYGILITSIMFVKEITFKKYLTCTVQIIFRIKIYLSKALVL